MRETRRGQGIIIAWIIDSFQCISFISSVSIQKLYTLKDSGVSVQRVRTWFCLLTVSLDKTLNFSDPVSSTAK